MNVYAFGFNLNGQIKCIHDETSHMHSDCLEPVLVDSPRTLWNQACGKKTDNKTCDGDPQTQISEDDSAGNQSLGQEDIKLFARFVSSWAQMLHLTGGNLVVRGYHKEKSCQTVHLPKYNDVKHVSSEFDTTAIIDQAGCCHLWLNTGLHEEPVEVNTSLPVKFSQVSVGDRDIAAISESGEAGFIEKEPIVFRPILQNTKVKQVSCGKEHTLILSRIGQVFSQGLGSRGQLGHGDTQNCVEARSVEALEGVAMSTAAAGGWHSVVISDIGDVYVWGWNESGQLGLPSSSTKEQDSSSTHTETINILTLPHLLQVPSPKEDEELVFTQVGCGSRHTAAITENGEVYTWGWNEHGQLGHGDTVTRDVPTLVQYFQRGCLKAVDISAGCWNTTATVKDKT